MLSTDALVALDDEVVRMLRTGEQGNLKIIGAGEITCVLEWRGFACKRLPPFAQPERLENYRSLLHEYLHRLRDAGVPIVDTTLQSMTRGDTHVAYLVQPRLPAEQFLPKLMRAVTPDQACVLLRPVLDYVQACHAAGIGIDANLSNWSTRDGKPLYLDVSTPMLRDEHGRHRLDTEIFVATLPAVMRGIVRRFLVNDLLDRYFDRRSVFENLIGDLPNSDLDRLTEPFLEEANSRLDRALTLKDIQAYRREDWWTWRAIRQALRIEEFWRRQILRTPHPHLLPSQFKRAG